MGSPTRRYRLALLVSAAALSCAANSTSPETHSVAPAPTAVPTAAAAVEHAASPSQPADAAPSAAAKERPPEAAAQPSVEPLPQGPARCTGDGVRVRRGPALSSDVVAELNRGEVVRVHGHGGQVTTIDGRRQYWHQIETSEGKKGWLFGGYLAPSPATPPNGPPPPLLDAPPLAARHVDSARLGELLRARGFTPEPTLKIAVFAVGRDPSDRVAIAIYDLAGTSDDWADWWPASAIKIYPAVAALERLHARGLPPSSAVRFDYDSGPEETTVASLVRLALGPSNNQAFDRLVELVGAHHLNTKFFTPKNGFQHTILLRSYTHRVANPAEPKEGSNRHSPAIDIRSGEKSWSLPERQDSRAYRQGRCTGIDRRNAPRADAAFEGNCTSLLDLAQTMLRVMLHEHLPEGERFDLGPEDISLLREVLGKRRSRGMGVVDGLRAGFGARPIRTWSKPGYALRWFSDNVFVEVEDTGEQYVVAMANFPGRDACNAAARHVGAILASGALRRPPSP